MDFFYKYILALLVNFCNYFTIVNTFKISYYFFYLQE